MTAKTEFHRRRLPDTRFIVASVVKQVTIRLAAQTMSFAETVVPRDTTEQIAPALASTRKVRVSVDVPI
jgi:hypothetical protein